MIDKEFNQPLYNLMYYKKLNNDLEHEVGNYLRERTNSPKLYSNDLRHQYVSALYARNFGNKTAKYLGDFNEIGDFGQSGRADSEVDKINNEIGRNYGNQYNNLPRSQLFDVIFNDYDKNLNYRKQRMKKSS